MRRWLCRVGATGHQQMPPINVLTGRPDEQHDLNISLSVSALFLEPTGFAREEHEMEAKTHDLVSSCLIMVCSNHRTKPCGMLITFERVWAVGRFDVGRIVFSPCHNNHELEQSPTGGVFEPFRGTCLLYTSPSPRD